MSEEYTQWLEMKREAALRKQERFMNGIAGRLGRPRQTAAPVQPFRGAPEFWETFRWEPDERAERFLANFRSVGGHAERLPSWEAARAFIAGKAEEMGAAIVLRQNQPELDALELEAALPGASVAVWNSDPATDWKARAAEADFGVVAADYAAAYTGSVTVLSSPDKGRAVSLLPTVLFVLIPMERLKTTLGEITCEFDRMGREQLPAGIHFISGPSRSADIENDLTIGVHGPGVVYALLIG